MTMQDYQMRVVAEKDQLDSRIDKLHLFLGHEDFANLDDAEKDRMRRQLSHMKAYSDVLGERIADITINQQVIIHDQAIS
ncbi:MAG: hypothetical protein MN733_24885 [Nitrososphaera sp.]|nr:hypothetical protein [Nitrososphaera sp.]